MITRLGRGDQAHNPRFIVTNLEGDAATLYDGVYCRRGEAENRIKEAQVGLCATRTTCHIFAANQLRVLLAALGYLRIERLRALASAQVDTRRIRLYLASSWPCAPIFAQAMSALRSP